MRTREYQLYCGSFYLYEIDGKIKRLVFMTDLIAVVYDRESFTLFKHGDPEKLKVYLKEKSAFCPSMEMATFPKNFPLEKINNLINNSSYLEFLLKEIEQCESQLSE